MNAPTPDIPKFLRRVQIIYTYTNLNTYLICPHQFYRRYVVKDLPFVETPAMKWGNDVHTAFEHRIGGKKPLPENMRQWESFAAPLDGLGGKVETQLGVNRQGKPHDYWDNKGVFLRGKLDWFFQKDGVVQMFDWKTGQPREDPFELEVGAMLLKMNVPNIHTIFGNYVWLKENRIGQRHNVSDTEATTKKVASIVKSVEADMANGENFEKKAGPLCGWCNVFDCENNKNEKRP